MPTARYRQLQDGEIDGAIGSWRLASRQTHRENRTLAGLARHGHVAAHHARELAREGKAKPRPAAEQRDELAPILIDRIASDPHELGPHTKAYRIGEDQSAGVPVSFLVGLESVIRSLPGLRMASPGPLPGSGGSGRLGCV
jgi:hypothetical protein